MNSSWNSAYSYDDILDMIQITDNQVKLYMYIRLVFPVPVTSKASDAIIWTLKLYSKVDVHISCTA